MSRTMGPKRAPSRLIFPRLTMSLLKSLCPKTLSFTQRRIFILVAFLSVLLHFALVIHVSNFGYVDDTVFDLTVLDMPAHLQQTQHDVKVCCLAVVSSSPL
jgi:hypothetical protein